MNKKFDLNMDRRSDLSRILNSTLSNSRGYFFHVIQAANKEARLSNADFWKHLFIQKQVTAYHSDTGKWEIKADKRFALLSPNKTENLHPDNPPKNPFDFLDIQACLKYLIHGEKFVIHENNGVPELATDSSHFFRYMKMSGDEKKDYISVCNKATKIRNVTAHETNNNFKKLDLKCFSAHKWTLTQLLEPFRHLKDTGEMGPVAGRFQKMDAETRLSLGGLPVFIPELCDLAKERSKHIKDLLSMAEFPKYENYVIADCQEDLLKQAVIAYLQKNPGAPTEKDVKDLRKYIHPETKETSIVEKSPAPEAEKPPVAEAEPTATEEAPVTEILEHKVKTVSPQALKVLKKCGRTLPVTQEVVNALLQGFLVTADESLFLCAEGRQILLDLQPILQQLGVPLRLDYSVISDIHTRYYKSKELRENPLILFPDSSKATEEELEKIRREQERVNENCKLALKALRNLRMYNCLECVSSDVPAANSFDNICHIANTYSHRYFMVLTMKRHLSEALGKLPSGNAVAAKATMDGDLLLLSATLRTWQSILEKSCPDEEDDGNETGVSMVLQAVDRTGKSVSIITEQVLGEGGEGTVYLTNHPDDLVAKVYHPGKINEARREKLQYMVHHNPRIPNLAWPCALLYGEGNQWVGYLMPKAPGKVLDDVVFHPGMHWKNITDMGWSRRHLAQICANIAHTFDQMHRKQMLMGDVNPRNIVVDRDCKVFFVDCDSYQFGQYECPVGKPDYTPPEIHKKMRELGITEYGYVRTEYNEMYSLAVLLFSTLLPGRAPYASRNAGFNDIVDAVIAGLFPFRINGSTENLPANMLAPAGVFRNIWSHITHELKEHFYDTFTQTGSGRRTAAQWENAMNDYIRTIELGHSSDALRPTDYKDISTHGKESAFRMLTVTCNHRGCDVKFNIGEDVYERRRGKFYQDFCGKHYQMMQNFRKREEKLNCPKCGHTFLTNRYHIHVSNEQNRPLVCENCTDYVYVTCQGCGRRARRNRELVNDLKAKGKLILCHECLNSEE